MIERRKTLLRYCIKLLYSLEYSLSITISPPQVRNYTVLYRIIPIKIVCSIIMYYMYPSHALLDGRLTD